jgi:hypothetical protein
MLSAAGSEKVHAFDPATPPMILVKTFTAPTDNRMMIHYQYFSLFDDWNEAATTLRCHCC